MLDSGRYFIFKTKLVTGNGISISGTPATPSRNRPDALASKPEVAASTKEMLLPSKSMPAKRAPTKHENINLNYLPNNKDKIRSLEIISWASLPANLLKPGKVDYQLTIDSTNS